MTVEAQKVSVVVPVYNEEAAIGPLLDELVAVLKNQDAEIIVVDDGSIDQSGKILDKAFSDGKIKLIRHKQNQGYGAALKSGIRAAASEKILILDGDGSYAPGNIPELISKSSQADMVAGARRSGLKVESLLRRITKFLVLKLLHYLAGYEVPDLNSGLRIFSKNIVMKYFSILPQAFSFTSTITLIFLSEGFRVDYIDIDYQPRQGKSKFRSSDFWSMLLLLLRTIMYFNPLKFFIPLSIFIAALALFIGFFSIFALGHFMDVTTSVLAVTSVQTFALGLIADLLLRLRK